MSNDQEKLSVLDRMPGADVLCPDGTAGQLELLGVRPKSDEITHLIIRRGFLFQRDLLIPAEWVQDIEVESNTVQLRAPLSEVVNLPEYAHRHGLLDLALNLALLPLRLPFQLALGHWRANRHEVQDRIIEAARRARAQDLLEHRVFDQAVTEPPLSVNLNTASLEALCKVRGIGHALAEQIIAHRPFQGVEDLHAIPTISPQTLARLREVAEF